MQLIGQYDSPFVRRVGIALTLYDMPFEHLPFSSFGDGAKFQDRNPLRRVPRLVLDGGEALIDSAAILDHLDEQVGRDRALIAPSGFARRAALRRIAVATGTADKAVSYFYARLFAPSLDPAFTARCEDQIHAGLGELDAACGDTWWHGDTPGHDDIAAACVAKLVSEAYAWQVDLADYPALAAHRARAKAQPAFRSISQAFVPPR